MLAYLDSLCTALVARNSREVRRLMRHPQASALPRRVREEVLAILRARPNSVMAPIHTLHFYHQTEQLVLDDSAVPEPTPQLELPLRPSATSHEVNLTLARARKVV
ncbi:MAG: hypothetical protein ABJD07_05630 [Gemmatimonadaceae bacterium]